MLKFTPADIQELLKDFMPFVQSVTALPSAKSCTDKQIVVVKNSTGISVYLYSGGEFILLASTSGNTVTSIFGRKGAVVAQKGDYTAEKITQDANNRFVTDLEISQWNAATAIRSQTGSVSVTANNLVTVTFDNAFGSTPVVKCDLSGVDDSSVHINEAHITRSLTGFTISALDIIQDGTIYWSAGV